MNYTISTFAALSATPAWMDHAECTRHDPNLFFPNPGELGAIARAKAICNELCADDIRDACHAYIMATEPPTRRHGVRAALTPEERTALARKRSRA